MKPRHLLAAACFLIAVAAAAAAQSAGAKNERGISGQWGTNGLPYLDLKYDGGKMLTGTVYWRHDSDVQESAIKSGSFDPDAKTFKIEGEAPWPPNGPAAKYLIEGKLDKETISGTYHVGDNNGQFEFKRLEAAR